MKLRRAVSPAVVVTISAVLAGCGNSASPGASAAAPSGAAGGGISVDLKEWTVTPSSATAPAGAVTFNVRNAGSAIHEFVVVKTDLKADALPVAGSKIDESVLTPVDEIEDIAIGATPSLAVTLEAGHYVLLCNIETHYGLGMRADFDVN